MALIKASNLPALTSGSEKQIAWATTIRLEYLSECIGPMALLERKASAERYEQVTQAHAQVVSSHLDAKWWIDNRQDFEVINAEMVALLKK